MGFPSIFNRLQRKLGFALPEKRPFVLLAESFEKRLAAWQKVPRPAANGARVGVLVAPWMFTTVPFYSLECALLLRSQGAEVCLLWAGENTFSSNAPAREAATIEKLFPLLPADLRRVDVAAAPADGEVEPGQLDRLIYENAVREFRGEVAAREFLDAHPEQRDTILRQARQVAYVFEQEAFDWILIPGGVWAISGLCVHLAERRKIPYTTFDCGAGLLAVAHDAVAAHHGNFARAFNEVWQRGEADASERALVRERALANLQIRVEGRDPYRLQPPSSSSSPGCDILVALNYRLDSAALLRQKLFSSVTDWLRSILEWLRLQPGITLAIRQHPCERIPEFRGNDRWEDLLAQFPDLNGRARFIAAEDPVNTYDLIAAAKVVLPFTSRVGIESSLLGKPVILCAHSFYDSLPFVWSPPTREEYFRLIGEALVQKIAVSPQQRAAAETAYFLAEECLMLSTRFTPATIDFQAWVEGSPEEWWASPETQDVRAVLAGRRNLPLVCYECKIVEAPQP